MFFHRISIARSEVGPLQQLGDRVLVFSCLLLVHLDQLPYRPRALLHRRLNARRSAASTAFTHAEQPKLNS